IAITDATPKRMPSDVRLARSLLCATASAAVLPLNSRCATIRRTRDGVPGASPCSDIDQPFGLSGLVFFVTAGTVASGTLPVPLAPGPGGTGDVTPFSESL